MLLDKLMHLVLTRLVGQAVSLTFAVSPGSMRYTAALISITFALILLNSVRQVYVARPVELLRSAEVGEREPKARWLLSLLGLAALGAGYWLSATVKDAAVIDSVLFYRGAAGDRGHLSFVHLRQRHRAVHVPALPYCVFRCELFAFDKLIEGMAA